MSSLPFPRLGRSSCSSSFISHNALLTPTSGSRASSSLPPNRVPPGALSVRDPRRGLLSSFFFSLSSPSPSSALPPPPLLYCHLLHRCSRPLPPPPLSRFRSFWKTSRKGSRGTFWDQYRRDCPTSRFIRFNVLVVAVRHFSFSAPEFSRPSVEKPPEIRYHTFYHRVGGWVDFDDDNDGGNDNPLEARKLLIYFNILILMQTRGALLFRNSHY